MNTTLTKEFTYLNTQGPWNVHTRNGHKVFSALGRRSVEITGHADTAFSIPARMRVKGQWVTGYVTGDELQDTTSQEYIKYLYFRPHDGQGTSAELLRWPKDNKAPYGEYRRLLVDTAYYKFMQA